jgi:hypothetical protein
MNRSEFETAYKRLLAESSSRIDNRGCLSCDRCERCADSTFCSDSVSLTRCHYCIKSSDCIDSAHLTRCKGCLASSHCVEAERCTRSAYVVRSALCSDCTYCFGCVGLQKKDFHILNEPYDRTTYFATVAKLSRELGL